METFLKGCAQPRAKEFFGFDWQFALTDSLDTPDDSASWREVQLPHDWSVDYPVEEDAPSCGSGGYARTGIGWYRRSFQVERAAQDRIALYFEGVYMNCDVWLNGSYVGGHIYGYTSFELDITHLLQEGENQLLVRVDNSHQPGSRWYTGSGITRPVYLVKTQPLSIKTWGVYVTTPQITQEQAVVRVETSVQGGFDRQNVRLETEILLDGTSCVRALAPVPAKDSAVVLQYIDLPAPQRWDIDTPVLYTLVSKVYDGETLMDQVETPFGVREIAYDTEQGFSLNGRKVILQGVCLHHDGGCVGAAVPPRVWERRLEKLREMGVNALRCSHNPPDPVLLDLADRMGFVVMDEAFDEWENMKGKEFGSNTHESRGYSEWFSTCWQEDMTAMVLRDRNHPSIIMWSVGNEVREQLVPQGWNIAKELVGLCHSLDPSRPTTQACDQVKAEPQQGYDQFMEELDIVGVNYTDRWRERTETFYDEEKREHPDWLLMGSEDGSVGGLRGDYRLNPKDGAWGRAAYHGKMLKAEKLWKFIRTRPYVLGSFMWTGIDYLGECFWPNKGSSAGVLDTCGYEKDGFHFYQSQWVKDRPLLHVCPHLNLDLEPGTVYPVIVYTNCFSVELLLGGKSYGVKCYEFPAQGMTQCYGHFDTPIAPITTNDLHLSWDVPYTGEELTVIGRDSQGNEIARQTLRRAGAPAALKVRADRESLQADGLDVVQLEISLVDADGQVVPDQDRTVWVKVQGGTLLGMDNGDPGCRELYRSGKRDTYRGLAYAVVQAPRQKGTLQVEVSVQGLQPVELTLEAE